MQLSIVIPSLVLGLLKASNGRMQPSDAWDLDPDTSGNWQDETVQPLSLDGPAGFELDEPGSASVVPGYCNTYAKDHSVTFPTHTVRRVALIVRGEAWRLRRKVRTDGSDSSCPTRRARLNSYLKCNPKATKMGRLLAESQLRTVHRILKKSKMEDYAVDVFLQGSCSENITAMIKAHYSGSNATIIVPRSEKAEYQGDAVREMLEAVYNYSLSRGNYAHIIVVRYDYNFELTSEQYVLPKSSSYMGSNSDYIIAYGGDFWKCAITLLKTVNVTETTRKGNLPSWSMVAPGFSGGAPLTSVPSSKMAQPMTRDVWFMRQIHFLNLFIRLCRAMKPELWVIAAPVNRCIPEWEANATFVNGYFSPLKCLKLRHVALGCDYGGHRCLNDTRLC